MDEISANPAQIVSTGDDVVPNDPRSDVLYNEDILNLIFSFFDPHAFFEKMWDIEPSTRKALFSASLTCKSFLNPALDLLWRLMRSLIPIFNLLPQFRGANDSYSFGGVIDASRLERFKRYTRWVRYLELSSFQPFFSGHSTLQLSSRPNFTLFPSLLALHIPSLALNSQVTSLENFNALFLVPGSSLRSLFLHNINQNTDEFVSSFLLAMSHKAERVQKVFLSGHLSINVLCLVSNFERLNVLSLVFDGMIIRSEVIEYFNTLPQLKHITIDLRTLSTFQFTKKITGLGALLVLNLNGFPEEVLKILNSIDHVPSLKTIDLTSPPLSSQNFLSTSSSIKACILACFRIAPCLGHLHMNMGSSNAFTLPNEMLLAFPASKGLNSFELKGLSIPINNADIRTLFDTNDWKQLCALHLPGSVHGHSPSLSSLNILAQYLPNLVSLTLPIDLELDSYEVLEVERLLPRGSHCLQNLTIIKPLPVSPPEHVALTLMKGIAAARFIEHSFPSIEEIKLVDGTHSDDEWLLGVNTLIAEFRAIRSERASELD